MRSEELSRIMHTRYGDEELEKYEKRDRYLKGGTWDKFFDLLGTIGYASAGFEMEKRQKQREIREKYAGKYSEDAIAARDRELAAAQISHNIMGPAGFRYYTDKELRTSVKYAVEHRVEMSEVMGVEGFWKSLAVNILSDPTSFIPAGAGRRVVGGVLRKLPTPLRQPLQAVGRGADLLADRAKTRVMREIGEGVSAVTGGIGRAKELLGEGFVLGYKFKRAGGAMKDFHKEYLEMVMERTGQASEAFHQIKKLGEPYKKLGKQATDYIESGVSTGNAKLDQYIDEAVIPHIEGMYTKAVTEGFDIGHVEHYVPRSLTKKGKKLFAELGEATDDPVSFMAERTNTILGRERGLQGTIKEINEAMGVEVFERDLWQTLGTYAQRTEHDITTKRWLTSVVEDFGLDPEKVLREGELTKTATKAVEELGLYRRARRLVESADPTRLGADLDIKAGLNKVTDMLSRRSLKGKTGEIREAVDTYIHKTSAYQMVVSDIEKSKQYVHEADQLVKDALERRGGKIRRADVEAYSEDYLGEVKRLSKLEGMQETLLPGAKKAYEKVYGMLGEPVQRRIDELEVLATKRKTFAQDPDIIPAGYKVPARDGIDRPLPTIIADFIDETIETSADKSVGRKIYDQYMKGQTFWKRLQTVGLLLPHSPFFARNVLTGTMQNIQEYGVLRTARGMFDTARLKAGKGTFKGADGSVDVEEMERLVRLSGVVESTGMADIAVSRKMFPTIGEKLTHLPDVFMTESESWVRIPAVLEEMRRGGGMREIRDVVNRLHFNYAPEFHTPLEMLLKAPIPFYTWTGRNLPRQIDELTRNPKFFQRAGQVQRESIRSAGIEEEYREREGWRRDAYLVANPLIPGGVTTLGMPFGDLGLLFDVASLDLSSAYFMLSPIKAALEIGMVQAGWGSEEYKEKKVKQIIERTATGRYGSVHRKMTDPDATLQEKVAYQLGASTYMLEPAGTGSFEEFDAARYRTYEPTKLEEYQSWIDSGQPIGFRTVTLGPPQGGLALTEEEIIHPPIWKFWEKPVVIPGFRPQQELATIPQELYAAYQAYPWEQSEWDEITQFTGEERTAAIAAHLENYINWQGALDSVERASTQQKIASWIRSGRPADAVHRSYHNEDGELVGTAAYSKTEMDEIQEYVSKRIQLSNAAFEWAFIQSDMPPEEFILQEFRKKHEIYLDSVAASEELNGFSVDKPVAAAGYGMTESMGYSAYRKGQVEHEQDLIERALARGELQ